MQVGPLGRVLTLYKRPVCCVDTQLASELLSADFLFWEPGAGPEKGAIYVDDSNAERTDPVQKQVSQALLRVRKTGYCQRS